MGRIRTIKPEFCSSKDTGALSREARLFFLQLLTEADDQGRMLWLPKKLAGLLYPHDEDVSPSMVTKWMEECCGRDMVVRYEVGGAEYLQITNWSKHQKVDHAAKSRLPSVTDQEVTILSRNTPENVAKDSRESREKLAPDLGSRNREQGTGKEISEELRSSSGNDVPDLSGSKPGKRSRKPKAVGEGVEAESHDNRVVELVLDCYHRILPNCRRAEALTDKRRRVILHANKLAKAVLKRQGWEDMTVGQFWTAYFEECSREPWTRGDLPNPNNPSWKQNIETLLDEKRFSQIMDQAIERHRNAGESGGEGLREAA